MSKPVTKPAKGTRDFLPADIRRREFVTGIIRDIYESYGFQPLETPAFERLETLTGKYGDEGDQLLFKVLLRAQPLVNGIRSAAEHLQQPGAVTKGRSGEVAPGADGMLADLGLRYDLTVPLARVVAAYQNDLPAVFKRFQIQPVWRADTPGKGRFREFYQCDLDIVGSESCVVEAEVASAACECMRRLGFPEFKLRINHRGLLRSMMDVAGVPAELETEAIVAIDKLDKIGADGVTKELESRGISAEARDKLLGLILGDVSLDRVAEFLGDHEEGSQAVANLREVLGLVSTTAAADHLSFDVSLARGLGYYTGAIFELAVPDLKGSLGGGGRYDGLVGMFLGRDIPACGFSLGLERILVVMAERDLFPASLESLDIMLSAAKADDVATAFAMSQKLRALGKRVELHPKHEKPQKLRKRSESRGVAWTVWLERGAWHAWQQADGETRRDLSDAALLDLLGS